MAQTRSSALSNNGNLRDIGTLWSLTRGESSARCVLLATARRAWSSGSSWTARSCGPSTASATIRPSTLAERWRDRMLDRGWSRLRA